jgi:hypothetical protein
MQYCIVDVPAYLCCSSNDSILHRREQCAECITIMARRTMGSASFGGRHFGTLIRPEHTGLRLMCHRETPNRQVVAQFEEACSLNLTPVCDVLLVNSPMI